MFEQLKPEPGSANNSETPLTGKGRTEDLHEHTSTHHTSIPGFPRRRPLESKNTAFLRNISFLYSFVLKLSNCEQKLCRYLTAKSFFIKAGCIRNFLSVKATFHGNHNWCRHITLRQISSHLKCTYILPLIPVMNLVSKHAFEFSFLYFCYSKPIPMEHPMENVRKRKVTNWVKFMRGGHFLPSPPPRFFRPSDNCTMGSDPQKKRGGTFCPTWHIASFPNFVERRVTPFPVFSFSFFSSNFAVT